jgi:hypothetical protein
MWIHRIIPVRRKLAIPQKYPALPGNMDSGDHPTAHEARGGKSNRHRS